MSSAGMELRAMILAAPAAIVAQVLNVPEIRAIEIQIRAGETLRAKMREEGLL